MRVDIDTALGSSSRIDLMERTIDDLCRRMYAIERYNEECDWYDEKAEETLEQSLENVVDESIRNALTPEVATPPELENHLTAPQQPHHQTPADLVGGMAPMTFGGGRSFSANGVENPGALRPPATSEDLRRQLDLQRLASAVPSGVASGCCSLSGTGVQMNTYNPEYGSRPAAQHESFVDFGQLAAFPGGSGETLVFTPNFGGAAPPGLPAHGQASGAQIGGRAGMSAPGGVGTSGLGETAAQPGIGPRAAHLTAVESCAAPMGERRPVNERNQNSVPDSAEISLMMKSLSQLGRLPELSKMDGTKVEKLNQWRMEIAMHVSATRPIFEEWWSWVNQTADEFYLTWVNTPVTQRSLQRRVPTAYPNRFIYVDKVMTPKLIQTFPSKVQEQVRQERQASSMMRSVDLIFCLLIYLRPDSLEEKAAVHTQIVNPNVCRDPGAALRELRRWQEACKRSVSLGVPLPSIDFMYIGVRSIFAEIFTQTDDTIMTMRFGSLEARFGWPHRRTQEGMRAIIEFAEGELLALQLQGRTGANPTMPLMTANQQARTKEHKDREKARAARAKAEASGRGQGTGDLSRTESNFCSPLPVAAAANIKGVRCSMTTSPWARPCTAWTAGSCQRGISCYFKHEGFPIYSQNGEQVRRCITCGKNYAYEFGLHCSWRRFGSWKRGILEELQRSQSGCRKQGIWKGKPRINFSE